MSNRRFGFRQLADARDLRFAMPPVSSADLPEVVRYKIGPVLNQGSEGACCGFAVKHLLTAEPFRQTEGPTAREIYLQARLIDEWPDPNPEEGTSVRAALQVAKDLGLIQSFHWSPNVEAVKGWLARQGPVDAGTNWHRYETNLDGRVTFDGPVVGGHSYLITGYDSRENMLFAVNSWGTEFGHAGEFYITMSDFEKQLQRGGCAAGVVEKSLL